MDPSKQGGNYPLYRYEPLDRTRGKIRLLRFLSRLHNTQLARAIRIQCVLETYELDHLPPYAALSYTWGHHPPSKSILVDNRLMPVGENLHEVLSVLRTKDQARFFSEDPGREADLIRHHFWIDAICVNQDDHDERGHQVNLMANIFSQASCVIAWLGPKSFNSWLGIRIIRTGEPHSDPIQGLNIWKGGNSFYHREAKKWEEAETSIVDLLSRPYWDRMWVVQEFLLPSNLLILYGDDGVWWERMEQNFLSKSPRELALMWNGRSVVTDYSITGWWNLNEARRRWQASPSRVTRQLQTLDRLLRQFHRGECRDVRDRVYALLSLVDPPPAATTPVLSADYNISARRLYYRVLSYLRHCSSLTNFLDWAKFRLLLSQALNIPQDDEFQLHESLYEITDVLQDGKLVSLGVAKQIATALAPRLRRNLAVENSSITARLQTFPRDEDPDAWRVFEQATDLIEFSLTQTSTIFKVPDSVLDVLKKESSRLREAPTASSDEGVADFIHTVRAMLEPDEDWLDFS